MVYLFQVKEEEMFYMMTVDELTNHANKFLMDEFGLELEVPILINGRLKSVLGRFRASGLTEQAVSIELAKVYLENNPKELYLDTLYHECIHYALYVLRKPYRDADQYFTDTCNRLGVGLTRTKSPAYPFHIYHCPTCEHEFKLKRRNRTRIISCGACHVELEYKGQKVTSRKK